jgi:glycosyltransferase involved in cell wall biosynthesis
MKITIAIPCYNEEKTVVDIINKVKKLKIEKEIIVVDDGSTDNSYEVIKNIKGIKVFKHEKNLGKGAAVRTALNNSTGNIFLVQDADLELDPIQIPSLIKPIINKKAEVVYGSRNIHLKKGGRSPLFYFGGLFVTFVTNVLYGIKLTDEPCGYKAFKTTVLKKLKIENDRFEWEPEITAKLAKRKIKIFEIPVTATSRSTLHGKKLKRRDGLKAIWTLIKYRFKY